MNQIIVDWLLKSKRNEYIFYAIFIVVVTAYIIYMALDGLDDLRSLEEAIKNIRSCK